MMEAGEHWSAVLTEVTGLRQGVGSGVTHQSPFGGPEKMP